MQRTTIYRTQQAVQTTVDTHTHMIREEQTLFTRVHTIVYICIYISYRVYGTME